MEVWNWRCRWRGEEGSRSIERMQVWRVGWLAGWLGGNRERRSKQGQCRRKDASSKPLQGRIGLSKTMPDAYGHRIASFQKHSREEPRSAVGLPSARLSTARELPTMPKHAHTHTHTPLARCRVLAAVLGRLRSQQPTTADSTRPSTGQRVS
jgi:hypothetical protein